MDIKEEIKEEVKIFFLKSKKNILMIRGRSMYPALQEGWSAEVSPIKEEDLKIGDIIIFNKQEELAVHRIVGKINRDGKTYLLQKGDNDPKPSFIEKNKVIGRVSRVFNSTHQEIPPKLWARPDKNEIFRFNLLIRLYLILYRIKKFIFINKENNLTRFSHTFYWKLFFGLLKGGYKV